jgi:sec-independent protein translocase protein TatC
MAKKLPTDDLFEKSTMTFGEHLEELRVCLFRGVVGIALGCLIGFFIANWVVRFFQGPLEDAMERYYIRKALSDYTTLYRAQNNISIREVPVEVQRQIIDEGLIPEPVQIETGHIAEVLGLTYPETFGGLAISQYWFTSGDFQGEGAAEVCRDMVAAKAQEKTSRGRLWQLLTDDQRQTVERLARITTQLSPEDVKQALEVLNDLAGQRAVHESPEFADISGPDTDVAATMVSKFWERLGYKAAPRKDTVAVLRKELEARFDAEKSRRLNKLLIAAVFPDSLRRARLNMLSLFTWRPVKVRFQVLNAQEAFMIWMKAALMTGLIIASPYIFYQIWIFVAAGLYPHEKHYVYIYLPISLALFFGGASLAFAFVFQPVLDFLFTFNQGMNADFDPRVGEWLSFVLILPLGFGISFQLPLVMLFLNRIGMASLDFYIQQWRVAILIICVISMVLTPADPVSMLLMAVPLCFLYLLGIAMCKYMPTGRSAFAEAYEP